MTDPVYDPYVLQSDKVSDDQERNSLRTCIARVLWGFLLFVAAVVGGLKISLLNLRDEYIACAVMGLWIAEFVIVWLLVRSYITTGSLRLLMGCLLPQALGFLNFAGLNFGGRAVPIEIVFILFFGGVGIYALSGWIAGWLIERSDFNWFARRGKFSLQISIRTILSLMVVSAVVAMVCKFLDFSLHTLVQGFHSWFDLLMVIIWFEWIAACAGVMSFLVIAIFRSKRRGYYLSIFLALSVAGAWIFQIAGLFNFRNHFRSACAFELGVTLGVLAVLPLLPANSSIKKERSE